MVGPKAAPKQPHAFSTRFMIACAPEPFELASRNATSATSTTTSLPTQSTSRSEAFFLTIGL